MAQEAEAENGHQDTQQPPIKEDVAFAAAYMTGGAAWVKLILGPVIFGEQVTQLPFTKLYNMIAGDSGGSTIASSLNIPVTKGSDVPRYNALEVDAGFTQTLQHALPKKAIYYPIQMGIDLLSMFSEATYLGTDWLVSKADYSLSLMANSVGRLGHKLTRPSKTYSGVDIHILEPAFKFTFKPLMRGWLSMLDRWAQAAKHDISNLYDTLDATYRFADTREKALLGDTIVSHQVTSMNVTRDEPAIHVHIKGHDGSTVHISDAHMSLSGISTGSCAAQTVYDDFTNPDNGDMYTDIADVNTGLTLVKTLENHLGKDTPIRVSVFCSGEPGREDLARMPALLFLRQMMSNYGSPLMRRRSRFVNKRDARFMRQDIGEDNVRFFDVPVTKETVNKKFSDDPKVVRMAKILGFDLVERDQMSHTERLPTQDIFDTRERTLQQLQDWAWDLVWHNAPRLVDEFKWAVQNSARQGRIEPLKAKQIVENLEWLYPSTDEIPQTENPPHYEFPNIKEMLEKRKPIIDFQKPQGFVENLKAIFKQSATSRPIIVRAEADICRSACNDNDLDCELDACESIPKWTTKLRR